MNRAFTLMEVLVAIGIFAVGMVAVASIFPPAFVLQRKTIDAVQLQNAQENFEALASVYQAQAKTPGTAWNISSFDVAPPATFNAADVRPPTQAQLNTLGLNNRSYPDGTMTGYRLDYSTTPPTAIEKNLEMSAPESGGTYDGELYFVPLWSDPTGNADGNTTTPPGPVSVYIVTMERVRSNATYTQVPGTIYANGSDPAAIPLLQRVTASPSAVVDVDQRQTIEITNAGSIFGVGDSILDNLGNTYVIKEVRADEILVRGFVPTTITHVWIGTPDDDATTPRSTIRHIKQMPGFIR